MYSSIANQNTVGFYMSERVRGREGEVGTDRSPWEFTPDTSDSLILSDTNFLPTDCDGQIPSNDIESVSSVYITKKGKMPLIRIIQLFYFSRSYLCEL